MSVLWAILGCLVSVGMVILMIASWWIIYDKMGEKGWKSLIPFYGRYVLFDCVWEAKIYFISLIFNALAYFLNGLMAYRFYQILLDSMYSADASVAGSVGVIIFALIFSFIAFVVQMILNWRTVKCFGKGIGFFLGLTFIPLVFVPILAFGNAYYDYY